MPNCPSCDNVEMIATDRGNTRECPICGYAEPHESTRPNRAARRAQQRSQKSPRPRQQRRTANEQRQQALFDTIEQTQNENPGTIIMVDELSMRQPEPEEPRR